MISHRILISTFLSGGHSKTKHLMLYQDASQMCQARDRHCKLPEISIRLHKTGKSGGSWDGRGLGGTQGPGSNHRTPASGFF